MSTELFLSQHQIGKPKEQTEYLQNLEDQGFDDIDIFMTQCEHLNPSCQKARKRRTTNATIQQRTPGFCRFPSPASGKSKWFTLIQR